MHCEGSENGLPAEPLFLRESRRRVYAAVFRSDKSLADFFGRPPMMSRRYSDRKLPLDLEDDIVTSDEPEVVNEALSKLDSNGWDPDSTMKPTSWIRLRYQMAVIKERFLEISLAGKRNGFLIEEIE